MTISTELRRYLLDDMSIVSRVAARIYPLRLPQPKSGATNLPAIVISRISELRWAHLRGAEALARPRYQVDCWAATHDAATELGALVRQRLNGFAGLLSNTDSPIVTVQIQAILFQDARDFFEEDIQGGLCRHSADYLVYHETLEGAV